MNRFSKPCLALCASLALAFPQLAQAGSDPLTTPAFMGRKASSAMMLGVAEAGNRLVAVGAFGSIVYSDDRGGSWTQAEVPVSVTLTAVYFPSLKNGWAVGHDGVILHTRDGGVHWVKQFDGNQANEQVVGAASQQLKLAQADAEHKPAQTQGVDLAQRALDDAKAGARFGPSRPLLGTWFKTVTEGFVVGAYGQIFRTTDGGKAWTIWSGHLHNPDGLHYNAISSTSAGTLLVAGEAGKVHRSVDGGMTWASLDTGYVGQLYGVLGIKEEGGSETLVAFGFGGNAFRSTDAGQSWQQLAVPTKSPLVAGAVFNDGQSCLLAQAGQIFCSEDGGKRYALAHGGMGMPAASFVRTSRGVFVQAGINGARVVPPQAAKTEK